MITEESKTQTIKRKVELEVELDTSTKQHKNPYQKWLDVAEVVDAYRIFPRTFITVYMYLLIYVVMWFVTLEAPTAEQSALISVVVGAGAAWFGLYTSSSSKVKNTK